MSSINLLPKDSSSSSLKHKTRLEIKIAPIVSFLMIIFSISFSIFLYFKNQNFMKDVESMNMEVKEINEKIEKETLNNEFLSIEPKGNKISFLLSKHVYSSKAIYFIQDNLIDEVFIDYLEISSADSNYVNIDVNGVVKNYSSIATQMYVLKNLPEVEDFNVKNISKSELGYLYFKGNLKLNKKVVFYNKNKTEEIINK